MAMRKKSCGMVVGSLLLLIGGGFTGAIHAQNINMKIGSVDIQKAINECNAGKEAQKTLIKEVEKFQGLIAQKQKELQEMEESLEKQSLMLNGEARAAREKELQARFRDYQRWGEDIQNEINQKRAEMERGIYVGLQKVIQKLGIDEGYTLILEKNKNIVLFTSQFTDITDLVIKAYDVQKK
jgi:outer membrane protein